MGNICSECMDAQRQPKDNLTNDDIVDSSSLVRRSSAAPTAFPKVVLPSNMKDISSADEDGDQDMSAAFAKLLENAQQQQNQSDIADDALTFLSSLHDNPKSKAKKKKEDGDYRGFAFCIHPQYGLLLLHCTRKKKKGSHYQVPGGHVDDFEFQEHKDKSWPEQLYRASRAACARELQEETGITLDEKRLLPVSIDSDGTKTTTILNEFKHRLFFVVGLSNQDFYQMNTANGSKQSHGHGATFIKMAQNDDCSLRLQLSVEHSGFRFERNPKAALKLLQEHSGGKVAQVLEMALMGL